MDLKLTVGVAAIASVLCAAGSQPPLKLGSNGRVCVLADGARPTAETEVVVEAARRMLLRTLDGGSTAFRPGVVVAAGEPYKCAASQRDLIVRFRLVVDAAQDAYTLETIIVPAQGRVRRETVKRTGASAWGLGGTVLPDPPGPSFDARRFGFRQALIREGGEAGRRVGLQIVPSGVSP